MQSSFLKEKYKECKGDSKVWHKHFGAFSD